MSHIVITSRLLPAPPIEAGGAPVQFVHCNDGQNFSNKAKVYCSTALDTVSADLIGALPESVGLIANLGVGYDNIDLDAAARRNIAVSNTPVVTEDTADLTFALILAAMRRTGANERALRAGSWSSDDASSTVLGARVHGKTLGLVGFGAIGQAVAQRACGFDMKILYTANSPKPDAEKRFDACFVADIDELLSISDIVSLHTPLTPETTALIDADRLEKFKPGAVFINTARGPIVDEDALCAALQSGQISAAGLDVFENEPVVSKALLAFENVVLTPHIGSATYECRMDIMKRGAANIVTFIETGEPIDRVRR